MNWDELVVPISKEEIRIAINDDAWQVLRASLHYTTMEYRYEQLKLHLKRRQHDRKSVVQVANYVNALKRGGMVK